MFRHIRVDHTNCLQVAIKTQSFIQRAYYTSGLARNNTRCWLKKVCFFHLFWFPCPPLNDTMTSVERIYYFIINNSAHSQRLHIQFVRLLFFHFIFDFLSQNHTFASADSLHSYLCANIWVAFLCANTLTREPTPRTHAHRQTDTHVAHWCNGQIKWWWHARASGCGWGAHRPAWWSAGKAHSCYRADCSTQHPWPCQPVELQMSQKMTQEQPCHESNDGSRAQCV